MKSLLLLTLFLLAQQPLRAQSKWMPINKKEAPKPPPLILPPPSAPLGRAIIPTKSKVELLLENSGPPLTFMWRLNADTVLPAEAPFQKTLELDTYNATMRTRFQKEAFDLKKQDVAPEGTVIVESHYGKTIGFTIDLSKDIATLTNRETDEKLRFKLFLNKAQTKILKIQNLETKEVYLPADFEGPTIMMGK